MAGRDYDLVVIGGGSAGLVATAGPALFGARVALVEKAPRLGGDCLNYGCVPSKAFVKAAKVAYHGRHSPRWGLPELSPREGGVPQSPTQWKAELGEVMGRVRAAIDHIEEHHDNPDRFRELGADVFVGTTPEFIDTHTLRVGERTLTSHNFLIASGSRPAVPPVAGLEESGYWTNETVWEQTEMPSRLMVVGAGPIGCELAQAFHRLGSSVTLVETLQCVLHRDDHELACSLRDIFIRDGIDVRVNSRVTAVRSDGATRIVTVQTEPDRLHDPEKHTISPAGEHEVPVDAILVATGRRPNIEGLNLDGVGVETSAQGIVVDEKLRTTIPNIYAAGDVTGGYLFTHVAEAEAKVVVGNVLFPGSRKMDYSVVPWSTFTDPELARVGLTEEEARRAQGDAVRVYRFPFADLDRAVCDGEMDGTVKVVANFKGEIFGAHILGASAGELIHEFVIALKHGLGLPALADTIHIYPTLAQADRRAADAFMREKYLGDKVGLAGKFLSWWASRRARSSLIVWAGLALSLLLTLACVSLPEPVGPTTLFGALPSPAVGAVAVAARAPGAIDGPLQIVETRFTWTHSSATAAAYTWQCVVDNPSQSTFEVTVVMQLLDIDGRPLESSNQAFRLSGGRDMPVEGEGIVEGDIIQQVASWRLEYWVKVPPRPPREEASAP